MMDYHSIILRRYSEEDECEKYYPIGTAESFPRAYAAAKKTKGNVGDIVIVCDTAYVADLARYARSVFVVDEDKEVISPKRQIGSSFFPTIKTNWICAFEGHDVKSSTLIQMCDHFGVDRKIIFKAILECVRSCIRFSRGNSLEAVKALDAAEKYMDGRMSKEDANKVRISMYYERDGLDYTTEAAFETICYATASTDSPENPLFRAAAASGDPTRTLIEFSSIIRSHISLSMLMMSAARLQKKDARNYR